MLNRATIIAKQSQRFIFKVNPNLLILKFNFGPSQSGFVKIDFSKNFQMPTTFATTLRDNHIKNITKHMLKFKTSLFGYPMIREVPYLYPKVDAVESLCQRVDIFIPRLQDDELRVKSPCFAMKDPELIIVISEYELIEVHTQFTDLYQTNRGPQCCECVLKPRKIHSLVTKNLTNEASPTFILTGLDILLF